MDYIKFDLKHLVEEVSSSSCKWYSSPAFARKLPKGIIPCDYDQKEKLIEVEFEDGHRNWIELKEFFGKVLFEVKDIQLTDNGQTIDSMSIVSFKIYKVKRTTYWNLIFECDLPF